MAVQDLEQEAFGCLLSLPGVSQLDFGIFSQREKFFFSFITVFQRQTCRWVSQKEKVHRVESLSGFSVV
jgi:hypothetical protein